MSSPRKSASPSLQAPTNDGSPENSDPPIDTIAVEPLSAPVDSIDVGDLMTELEFHDFIAGVFPITAAVLQAYDGRLYRSIIEAPGLPTAGPAFSAIYRSAKRSEYLRFLISKDSAWLQDMLLIGAFGSQVWSSFAQEWSFYHQPHPSTRAPGQRGAPSGIRVSPAEKRADERIIIGGDYSGFQPGSASVPRGDETAVADDNAVLG